MRRNVTVTQAPGPLPVPDGWSLQERRLVSQLNAVIADIYRRWGRLGLADFSVALRQAFDRKVTVEAFESVFLQTAQALSVQFGTPEQVIGPTLEVSKDRLYAKVQELVFEIVDEAGKRLGTVEADGDVLRVGRLAAKEVLCEGLLRRNEMYETLFTDEKSVLGAINELKLAVEGLGARLDALALEETT